MKKLILLATCLFLLNPAVHQGCDKDGNPASINGNHDPWKDLTEKEDTIDNLLLCYEKRDIAHYEELLHPDYVW